MERWETGPSVVALSHPQGLLLRTLERAFFLPLRIVDGQPVAGRLIKLLDSDMLHRGRNNSDWLVRAAQDYLVFDRTQGFLGLLGGRGLEKLGVDGFEPVPGADLSTSSSMRPYEIASRGLVALSTDRGLYLFDGARVSPVEDSDPAKIGRTIVVYDLPSIGKILIRTFDPKSNTYQLHELSSAGRLLRLVVPFAMKGTFLSIDQMPASRLAVLSVPQGIFSMDADGTIRSVRGSESEGGHASAFVGLIPEREEMIFNGRTGLHLLVDQRISGKAVCGH